MGKKIQFSARKDPLLRTVSRSAGGSSGGTVGARNTAADARPPAAAAGAGERSPSAAEPAAVEGPDGVIAVAPAQRARSARRPRGQEPPATSRTAHADVAPASPRDRHGRAARRVQTSMSLPPDVWDALDELGRAAGVSAGELLTVVLEDAVPKTPAGALTALEQLLRTIAPNEGPQEERNYRIPLTLRAELDALTDALGSGARVKRSLLIRALLASNTPAEPDDVRELITARRIDSMRTALHAGADQ